MDDNTHQAHTRLQQHYDRLCTLLDALREQHAYETRPEEKLRIDALIQRGEAEYTELEDSLNALEQGQDVAPAALTIRADSIVSDNEARVIFDQRGQQVNNQYNAGRDIHVHPPTNKPFTPPLQRPPRPEYFTGRDSELNDIIATLQAGHAMTICGPGGMGKTALATEVLWALAPADSPPANFPDGILFHSFYNQPSAEVALEAFARALGEDDLRPSPAEAVKRALDNKRLLLVLDGVEDADDLRKITNLAGRCGLLITTRDKRDAPGQRFDLQPLDDTNALSLLHDWAGEQEQTAAQDICELLGGLPLALRLAGRYLNETGDSAIDYLDWLRAQPMQALNPDDSPHRLDSVPWLLQRSVAQVSDNARIVLSLAGQLALAPFNQQVVEAVLQFSNESMRLTFRELTNYGLIQQEEQCWRTGHALIHTWAREHLPLADELWQRLTTYYLELAQTESARGLDGYLKLDTERANFMRLLSACQTRGDLNEAHEIIRCLHEYLQLRGHFSELFITVHIGLELAQQHGNRHNELGWLVRIGNTYWRAGYSVKALDYYQQALELSFSINSPESVRGHILVNLGIVYKVLGETEKPIKYYEEALSIAEKFHDLHLEEQALGHMGEIYNDLGEPEKSAAFCQKALFIARKINNRENEGIWLGDLGNAFWRLGELENAIKHYQQAIEISHEIGYRQKESIWLNNLGSIYRELGEIRNAIEHTQQALNIAIEIRDLRNAGACCGNMGNIYLTIKQFDKAMDFYQKALKTARRINYKISEITQLGNIGNVHHELKAYEQAIECQKEALVISCKFGYQHGQASNLMNLGNSYLKLKKISIAIKYQEEALAISREINSRQLEGSILFNLGVTYEKSGNIEKAISCLQEALLIMKFTKSPDLEDAHKLLESLTGKNLQKGSSHKLIGNIFQSIHDFVRKYLH